MLPLKLSILAVMDSVKLSKKTLRLKISKIKKSYSKEELKTMSVPIIKKDGTRDLRWYPKCKLVENSDKTATSTATHSDQTDTLTIRAYGFDADMNQEVSVLTNVEDNAGITEAAFFAAPLTTVAGAKALRPSTSNG